MNKAHLMVAAAVLFATTTSVIANAKTDDVIVTVTNSQKQPVNRAEVHVTGDDVSPPIFAMGYTNSNGTHRVVIWSRAHRLCFQAEMYANRRPYTSPQQCFYPPYPATVELEVRYP